MKIAKTGFFLGSVYRLAYYGCGMEHCSVPENLCPFVRRAIWGLCLCVIVGLVGGVWLAMAIVDPVVSLVLWVAGVGEGPFICFATFAIGSVLWALAIGITGTIGIYEFMSINDIELPKIPKPARTTERNGEQVLTLWGLICEYSDAIHDKMCPRIEFK